jgi:hypothetical protein
MCKGRANVAAQCAFRLVAVQHEAPPALLRAPA